MSFWLPSRARWSLGPGPRLFCRGGKTRGRKARGPGTAVWLLSQCGPQRSGYSAGTMPGFPPRSFPPRKRGPRSRDGAVFARADLSALGFLPVRWLPGFQSSPGRPQGRPPAGSGQGQGVGQGLVLIAAVLKQSLAIFLGVFQLHQSAAWASGPRDVSGGKAGNPEPERCQAQQCRPPFALDLAQRSSAAIGGQHGSSLLAPQLAVGIETPVVDRHGQVVEQNARAGAEEVDHPG